MGGYIPSISPPKKQVHHYYYGPPPSGGQYSQNNGSQNGAGYQKGNQNYHYSSGSNQAKGSSQMPPSSSYGGSNGMKGNYHGKPMPVQDDPFTRPRMQNKKPQIFQDPSQNEPMKDQHEESQQKKNDLFEKKMLDEEVQRLEKAIAEYESGIEKAKEYGRKMQDPTKFDEFRVESLEVYIKRLQEMNLLEKDVAEDGFCKKVLVGKISSGKSSLLNAFLGLNLEAGVGETTLEPALVYNNDKDKIQIFDTPGENEDFNTQKVQNIRMIAQTNEVFILFPDSLKNSEHLVRVITAIKPKHTYLIRTQCDKASKKDKKTVEEEIETDKKVLEKWGIKGVPVYATSAKSEDLYENKKVKELLLRHPMKN